MLGDASDVSTLAVLRCQGAALGAPLSPIGGGGPGLGLGLGAACLREVDLSGNNLNCELPAFLHGNGRWAANLEVAKLNGCSLIGTIECLRDVDNFRALRVLEASRGSAHERGGPPLPRPTRRAYTTPRRAHATPRHATPPPRPVPVTTPHYASAQLSDNHLTGGLGALSKKLTNTVQKVRSFGSSGDSAQPDSAFRHLQPFLRAPITRNTSKQPWLFHLGTHAAGRCERHDCVGCERGLRWLGPAAPGGAVLPDDAAAER